MPYATLLNGEIKAVYTKPNPLVKLKPDERVVKYDPPEFDLQYYTITPVIPVTGKFVEFTVEEKPGALEKKTQVYVTQIDFDVDRIYKFVIGSREPEYRQAEAEALAFQAANFQGVAPPMVQVYADADGLTPTQAAQSILTKSEEWRQASTAIRSARLQAKSQVRSGDFTDFQTAWPQFLQKISTALGITL